MARDIPQEIVGKIVERPVYLTSGMSRGNISMAIAKLCSGLAVIDATKAICYDVEEFCKAYYVKDNTRQEIKKRIDYIKTHARITHKIKAKAAVDNNSVYFWKVNV